MRSTGNPYPEGGFTLVELVVVIVVIGILTALGGQLLVSPVTGYLDLSRRTRLVDQADGALRRIQRDIRHALPNSIRIDATGQYLELLNGIDGGRYRRYPDPASGGDVLDFATADSGFDVLGGLTVTPAAGQQLVVYNISASGSFGNAYAGSGNRATIGAGSSSSRVVLSPPYQFSSPSPYQRFFVVDGPVMYACEGGELNRYADYAITSGMVTPPGGPPALMTRNVSSCSFSYDPGSSQRAGLVTLKLALTEAGESMTLLHQVHVVNVP